MPERSGATLWAPPGVEEGDSRIATFTVPEARPGFSRTRVPDPGWQQELHAIAPRNDQVPWLYVYWLAGDTWEQQLLPDGSTQQGVQRWVILEMHPEVMLREKVEENTRMALLTGGANDGMMQRLLRTLEGENPRLFGKWNPVRQKWESSSMVHLFQWELWQFHRAYAVPVWIVQGTKGGHKWDVSNAESRELQLAGLPKELPAAGALPYAEPDRRTWAKLLELDVLRKWDRETTRRWSDRTDKTTDAEKQAEIAIFRKRLLATLRESAEECADMIVSIERRLKSDVPRLDSRTVLSGAEQAEDDFIYAQE